MSVVDEQILEDRLEQSHPDVTITTGSDVPRTRGLILLSASAE